MAPLAVSTNNKHPDPPQNLLYSSLYYIILYYTYEQIVASQTMSVSLSCAIFIHYIVALFTYSATVLYFKHISLG